MKQAKTFITNKYMMFVYGTIFLFVLWWIVSLFSSSLIIPSPFETFKQAGIFLQDPYTYSSIGFSFLRMILGFLIAFFIAFILGLIVNDNVKLYQFFTPLMTFFKSIPTAALVFLFIVLVSAEYAPMLVVILIATPILYEAIVGGFQNSPYNLLEAARIDGANKTKLVFKIQLPLSVPYIVIGIISAFSLSFKIEIMAEVITGYTKNGLGSLIKVVQINNALDMVSIFAYSLIAVVLMLVITLIAHLLNEKIKKIYSIEK